MVYIIVIGFIVAVIVIANSDSETPGSAQASQTTPKPTMTPLPTFTPKPPTATPSPTGTPISTATLTLSTACGWEDIADFDTEDVSNANVTRLAVRFNLPPNCTAQDMLAYAATHAALVIAQDDSIDAIGYFFFCDPEQIGFGANIGIDFAPYGDWSRAGETKKGDYGKHEVVLQFAKDVPCE
ncbi:MAG: hypothetical protein OXF86_01400 [Caldilineaceae bacterium]|nr:hypothetical protein [Caldilineaceae bacterium]